MLSFVFPGQGSQKRGMGHGLFDEVREFTSVESNVDALLGYSVRKLCLEDPDDRLKETQFTQPALYVVNALHYYDAVARGDVPRFVAGHSLGEYNALLAAGVFDFLTGLRLVKERGRLMSHARNGGMAAVIGLGANRIGEIIRTNALGALDVANFNSPSQSVISGPLDDIKRAGPIFEGAGARMYMTLPVSAAFHSRYMAEVAELFARVLSSVRFESPQIPVISNVTGAPYPSDPDAIRSLLAKQVTHSVQWMRSVRHLLAAGVTTFKEIGPGTVLTRLIQQVQREADG